VFSIGSLFSGIGGLDLAAHWAGFDTKWFVEKEPFCQKVLAKHWPNAPIYDDVFTCAYPPSVDVIVGGFPCQPFSVAGNREGKDDERYLLPEMLRIVDEVKPYAVLFENVPGFPSLNDGVEFKYLLRTLAEMGFDAEWGHIFAKDAGAPHQRERWFLVAYAASDRCGTGEHCRDRRHVLSDFGRSSSQAQPKRDQWERGISENCENEGLGNTERMGLNWVAWGRTGAQLEDGHTRFGGRQAQPRIRGTADGLPGWLDFVGFPARPGEPQHAYEPPRTAPSTPTTNARIKALGNAVVPQVAYPIFQALAEWMEESTLTEDDPL